ncbi:MAG: Aldose 1-epimerase, partial [uncultured Nocardioides sp.]
WARPDAATGSVTASRWRPSTSRTRRTSRRSPRRCCNRVRSTGPRPSGGSPPA